MKTLIKSLLLIATIAFFASCGGSSETATEDTSSEETTAETTETVGLKAGTYTIAANESNAIKWVGTHLGGNYKHTGNIMLSGGSLTVTDGKLTAGSLEINMGSITVTDIPADDEKNGKLVGHLTSGDFFSVEEFPTASFTVKSVAEGGEGDATHTITGDLTIKGKTAEVSVPVMVSTEGNSIMAKGTMVFDRTNFDVMYNSGTLEGMVKDKIISDDVKLEFDLTATM